MSKTLPRKENQVRGLEQVVPAAIARGRLESIGRTTWLDVHAAQSVIAITATDGEMLSILR